MDQKNLKLDLQIPFSREREAKIAYDVLRVDQETPRSHVSKILSQSDKILNVSFSATSAQQLRVGEEMSEHTPSPTPSRGVYGFVLYLACICSFGLYLIWAVIPDQILHLMGITYYPQKYWAIALPIYVMMGTALFAFFIYPGLNLLLTPPLDDIRTITDSHSLCKQLNVRKKIVDYQGSGEKLNLHGIPGASDISISEVCRSLYLNK